MISGHLQFAFVLFAILSSSACTNNTVVHAFSSTNATDQQALLDVKSSIRDPSGVLSSWNHSLNFCLWQGVTCNRRHGRVMELNLSSQQLEGTLSPYIGNLSFLSLLNLEKNNFHGSIPSEIRQLFRLRRLQLGYNSFQGAFPANLTHWYDIQVIDMSYNNHLSGNLPTEFTSWSSLTNFILVGNNFTGSIPPSVGNMSSLTVLDLAENNLVGSIPWEIAKLSNLTYLALSMNNLSGMVPLPLYNLSLLYNIALADNYLEGSIPSDLGFTLPNLEEFCIGNNKFSGSFPPSIANASNLVRFEIGGNNITGPLQVSFERVPNLQTLILGDNPLGFDKSPSDLISSLVNCTQLKSLALHENGFKGELPKSVGNLSTSLDSLLLYSNYIYGSIPKEITKLVSMTSLDLSENSLTGVIPETIGQLYNLGLLYLFQNNISGEIPTSISNITRLSHLALHKNMLQGSIPPALFSIQTLDALRLYGNRLSGGIPEQLVGLSSQCNTLYLQQNLLTGSLPSNIGSFKHLVSLDVSGNKLTGEIPSTLGDCEMLELLAVGGNLFEGSIPPSFKKLRSLKTLDLSSNLLSGEIPSFLGGFPLLQNLNLSRNNLEGEVPKEGVFFNISAFSVVGNMQLCGGIQALQLPACQMNKKRKFPLRLIPLLVILPLAMLLASIALIIYRPKRPKMNSVPVSEVLLDNQHPRVSYRELSLATDDYSQKNLVGEGRYASVYKGMLKSLEQYVAVKVINVEVRGANKSFLAECEMLRNIRHRNLIKIITACSTTDHKGNSFKAMVLEFMQNGSLDNWLHPSASEEGKERNLTLLQRLNISIDVASALAYLHHHSHTRIVHCDIKPSNILLDKELVARVGDFGLAKFFFASPGDIISQPHTNSTGVRGTIGYIPPEYGMGGEISAEGDVYSYGILLLELFSGKRPTDSLLNSNLHDYVKQGLPQRVMDIVDQRITQENSNIVHDQSHRRATESCLASVFEVGISCSVEAPKERLDISVALKQLIVARDSLLRAGTNTE